MLNLLLGLYTYILGPTQSKINPKFIIGYFVILFSGAVLITEFAGFLGVASDCDCRTCTTARGVPKTSHRGAS